MSAALIPWIVARATGFAAFGLVTAAVLAGLLVRTRRGVAGVEGAGMADLHRHLSFLALCATGVHGLALALDTTVWTPLYALVVPGTGGYRPLATGIGVVAAELALLIHLSFRWRSRIGARNWRRLHYATYLVFAGAAAHGIAAGTDWGTGAAFLIYTSAIAAVAGATIWRVRTGSRARARRTPALGRAA